ncbi:fibronectin type III domain-containing protein [uncultured Aquimarina sp.]|uniref:fibronectin type III domain-containing protein n=1 Tax=uncultured Aquimarina sp. TaxID=575652 RepID=UPI00260AD4A4|nr:fibronectin type III domain-containing protein [uncultured Aquimarina sp.]
MKRKITHYALLAFGLVALPIGFMIFSGEKSIERKEKNEITSLRDQHKDFLNKSPFTETLKMTRAERKAQGLPPNKYFEQLWELSINPATGRTEPEKIYETQEMLKRGLSKRAPGDDANNPWIERGPNDIGGRTRAIMFDPNDSSNRRVYAGGVSGGLWVNNDITSSTSQWSRVQNVPGNLSVTSITVDPRDSNIWYLGTGEQYTAGDVVGSGIYRSTDGGTSWQSLAIPPAGAGSFDFNASNLFLSGIFYVNDILAWNNIAQNRTELFVGVGAHVYGDAANPTNWLGLQTAGLYRSIDNGATWNRIESTNMSFVFSGADYFFIPNDFEIGADNTLWMGTITTPGIGGAGGGRVFSSTNGATWTEAAGSPLNDSNRVEIEVSTTDANKLYALTQGSGNTPVHIYRTTNKFGSVTETALPNDADNGISANDFTRGQAFYDLMIEADPTNDDIVYVGGIDLFRSANSGNSWGQISKWSNNPGLAGLPVSLVHADQHAMTFRPGNSNQAIFGTDGGVYYANSLSTAQNSNVFGARNNNYNVTQYVKAGIGPDGAGDTSGIFTAGAQDNGSQAFRNTVPGINGSEELSDGDGFYTFVDKDGQYMTATFVRNVIYRFNLPWDGRGRRQGGATTLVSDQSTGDFVNQMGYDSDANFMLTNASAGSSFAIKTINVAANSNTNITNALLTSKPTALTPSPFENNVWYVGTATGQMLRLTNVGVGSANWSEIATPFVGSVSSVRLGETANDIMVTMHNYGVTSVWYSSDAGANWVSKEGDLPDIPVRDMLQNPLDRNEVIVGTQLGVWVTTNFDAANPTWNQSQNGMSDASVTSFDYWAINGDDNNNKIIASTYGRGVFTGSFTANGTSDTTAPSVPTNLTAANTTQTTTDLSWTASTDNVGVTGYDVYQDGVVVTTVTGTSYNVTGLTANTSYSFVVRAKDAAGNESADSNIAAITTSGTTGGGGCSGGITAFPYDEGFEGGFGDWTQGSGDDFDWIRRSGGTPSNNTGPSAADEGSFYVYVETSNPNNPNRTTILNSPCFDLSGETTADYSFRYHMTGNAVGELRLEASSDNGTTWTSIWSRSGDQGNSWNSAAVNLDSYTGSSMQLRYVGTSGNSWQGDMAVDRISLFTGSTADTTAPTAPTNLTGTNTTQTTTDLSWTAATDNVGVTGYDVYQDGTLVTTVTTTNYTATGLTANTSYAFIVRAKDAAGNESADSNTANVTTTGSTGNGCTAGITSFPYNQGFEGGFGDWTQGSGDDFDWIRRSGGTPSNNTGPSSADEGSFYVYVETSNPNNPNRTTILNSPCFDLSGETSADYSFRYHMTGNAVGVLKLEASSDNGTTWTEVWSRSGTQGNAWNTANVNLDSYAGASLQLRYVGTSGNSWQGDMAVDRISLSTDGTTAGNGCTGGIASFPYNQGFEGGFGSWSQGSGDDFDWIRRSGGTPSNNTGPSSADEGTFYVYVETSNPNNPNRTTILNSPCFDLSSAASATFGFRYHMTGNAVGELKLEASSDNGITWTEVWSRSGTQGNAWNTATVNLDSYVGDSMQLRYVGTSGNSWQGDMAVDAVSLSTSGTTAVNDEFTNSSIDGSELFEVTFYPNPVSENVLYLNTSMKSTINYTIMSVAGQLVDKGVVSNNSINVQRLPQGVYIIRVATKNSKEIISQFIKR